MSSFQSRIRSSTLVLVALLLSTFSLLLYGSLSILLKGHLDSNLLALAKSEATQVELTTGRVDVPPMKQDDKEVEKEFHEQQDLDHETHELLEAIRWSVVLEPGGQVVWKGDAVTSYVPSTKESLARAWKGETVFETLRVGTDRHLRRISLPIVVEGKPRYLLQTQTSLEFVENTMKWLVGTLTIISLLVLALSWVGSGWIAQQALAPVETLSRTAGEISEKTLSKRLMLDAPYVEFQKLAQAFNGMLERLHKVFEAQRRFVADAAHEIKTPLTAIKGNLEVTLQKVRTPDTYQEAIGSSLMGVDRLIHLTRSLLTLAEFEGNRPCIQQSPLSLGPLIQEVTNNLSPLAEDRGINILLELQPVTDVSGDATQLQQVLINLLDNAIRHTPQDGTIHVRLSDAHDDVRIEIQDSGSGIEAQHLPYLFERFYRTDPARDRSTGGTGLGLAIVKEIVDAHGGRVEVQSEKGKGTCFSIFLPKKEEKLP